MPTSTSNTLSRERALERPRGTRGVCALAGHDDRQSRAISLPQAKRGRGRPPTHHFKAQRPAVGVRCASVAARSVRHIAGPSCLVVLTISLSLAPPCFAATTNPTQPNIALPATRSPGHRQDQYGRRQAHVLCCLRSLPQFTNPPNFQAGSTVALADGGAALRKRLKATLTRREPVASGRMQLMTWR